MKKRYYYVCMILPLVIASCSSSNSEPIPEEPNEPVLVADEFVANNQFEDFVDFTGNKGVWKIFGGGKEHTGTAIYKENSGYKGSNTIRLRADEGADIAVSQYLSKKLEYRKLYRLSGRIKTESVSGDGGANLAVVGSWSRTDYVKGSSDWTYRYIDFFGPKNGELAISTRLGFWYAESTGIAYFDNIRITEPDDVYIKESANVQVYLAKNLVYGTDQEMQNWLNRLNNFYLSYVDLFKGKKPYDGQKMIIQSNPGNVYWAFAGEFIQWNENYVNDALKKVVEQGDVCFGIVHEIAHNFAPGNWDIYNGAWIWDEEVMANFRMAYALEDLDESVLMNNQIWKGSDIINFYKQSYDTTLAQGNTTNGINDAILYTMLRITQKYGWEPIKLAFEELYALNKGYSPGASKWKKFEYFLDAVSKHTSQDVKETYKPGELEIIKSHLN